MLFFLMPKTTFTLLSSFSLLKLHIIKNKKIKRQMHGSERFINFYELAWIGFSGLHSTAIICQMHTGWSPRNWEDNSQFPDFKNAKSYHVEMMGGGGIKDSTLKWTGLLDWTTTMDHHRYSTPALPARVNISEYNYTDTCRYTALGNGKP